MRHPISEPVRHPISEPVRHRDPELASKYPSKLLQAISTLANRYQVEVFVVGGTVRDWLSGKQAKDLDLAVSSHALDFARELAADISGTFVLLDDGEQTARVVWRDLVVDIAVFRSGVTTILDDLVKRDFTINGLAIPFEPDISSLLDSKKVIDPSCGLADLADKIIRVFSAESFVDDPLRLLRAFRFFAETGFEIEPATWHLITQYYGLISSVSVERVIYELDCIMASPRAYEAVLLLYKSGLLFVLFPELKQGEGIDQPASHHLDVFEHNMAALEWIERILQEPARFFPHHGEAMATYLAKDKRKIWLKWAALFHDLGKPAACKIIDERITFYNHDRVGAEIIERLAKRIRWSREQTEQVSRLVSLHMWPFHLSNIKRKNSVTPKACLKLYKTAAGELPGLFLLTMADSLAGQGPGKPPDMEQELAELFGQVIEVCEEKVEPVLAGPPLLSGKDLIGLGLTPGPLFNEIFSGLEKAQVIGEVEGKEQGIAWVREFVKNC